MRIAIRRVAGFRIATTGRVGKDVVTSRSEKLAVREAARVAPTEEVRIDSNRASIAPHIDRISEIVASVVILADLSTNGIFQC